MVHVIYADEYDDIVLCGTRREMLKRNKKSGEWLGRQRAEDQ